MCVEVGVYIPLHQCEIQFGKIRIIVGTTKDQSFE